MRAATTRCKSFLVTLTSLKIEKRAPLRDSVYRVYPYWVIFARTEGQKLEIASVSHFITDKKKLILRVKRIRGQIDGIERAIASDEDCVKIVQAIASIRGALTGLMGEVLESHVAEHVVDPRSKLSAGQLKGTKELLTMIKTYVK
jgi:DNA-binding FrmR family transcriptional regulator